MKILYLEHYAGSDSMGMEFRPYYLAREWQRHGVDTTILAGDYSHLRKVNPSVLEDLEEQVIDGVRYCFLRTGIYPGNGLARIQSMARFVLKGRRAADELIRRYAPDVVIASSTYPMDTFIGQRIRRRTGALLVHEIHDLWPLTPRLLGGYSSHHPFIAALQAAEDSAYRNSDLIVSILPNAEAYVRSRGFTTPVVHIPNGLPSAAFPAPGETPPADERILQRIRALRAAGAFIVGYAGGLSVSNAMTDFIRAMAQLADEPRAAAIIIGDGIERRELMALARSSGLTQVYFEDPIPKAAVIGTLTAMDALYLGSQPSPLYEYGVSANKIFDYLLAGRPIINAWDTNYSPMDEAGTTLKVRAGDPQEIAAGIRRAMALGEDDLAEIARRSRRYVREHHHYDQLALDFLKSLEERKR